MGFPITDWAPLFPDFVSIESAYAMNASGQPIFSTCSGATSTDTSTGAVSYQALCQGKQRFVRDKFGNERVSTVTTYLMASPDGLTVDDRITLPVRFQPNQPPIMAIEYVTGLDGPHHVKVMT